MRRNIYISKGARACDRHLNELSWNTIQRNVNQRYKFSTKQIEDLIQLLRNSGSTTISETAGEYSSLTLLNILHCCEYSSLLFLSAIGPQSNKTMRVYIGLNFNQFQMVLRAALPFLLQSFKNSETLRLALYIYFMKMRTNHTNSQIAPLLNISEFTVSVWIRKVRSLIHKAIVPRFLYNRSREELLRNTTQLSRQLYEANNETVVLTIDATYVFTIKSSNYSYQKKSFSVQFGRNLIKFMLFVSTNGFIAAVYGPFEAKKNDATILNEIINEQTSIFEKLLPGDIVVVDRGFRDVVDTLKNRGLIVKLPKGTQGNKMTRNDANESRLATKTRFVVEVRNSHIKNKWKYLSGTKVYQSIPHLKMDFQTCAALVNAFCGEIQSDKHDWDHIGDLMLFKKNEPNILSNIIHHIPNASFRRVNNLTLFPKLSYNELREISQGTYQIRQAKSYCQSHVEANNNTFIINVCDDINLCQRYFGKIFKVSSPLLLSIDLLSRFQSNKYHKTYALLEFDEKYTIRSYCCSCRHGCRTVGCCSHVMAMIWFTLHIDQTNMVNLFPSSNLNHVFDNWQDEYFESELESDLDFDSSENSSSESDTH